LGSHDRVRVAQRIPRNWPFCQAEPGFGAAAALRTVQFISALFKRDQIEFNLERSRLDA